MPRRKQKIYLKSFDEAGTAGETKQYHESMTLNRECVGAIVKAIADNYKGEHIYDLKSAAESVIKDFGTERTKFVMALHLKNARYDGRFSQVNISWADTLDIPDMDGFKYIHMSSHATLLNGFADRLREAAESRENIKSDVYKIKKTVLFSDNHGFVFAGNKSVVAPFITWQYKDENGERNYYGVRYFNSKADGVNNFKSRAETYKIEHAVEEIKEKPIGVDNKT